MLKVCIAVDENTLTSCTCFSRPILHISFFFKGKKKQCHRLQHKKCLLYQRHAAFIHSDKVSLSVLLVRTCPVLLLRWERLGLDKWGCYLQQCQCEPVCLSSWGNLLFHHTLNHPNWQEKQSQCLVCIPKCFTLPVQLQKRWTTIVSYCAYSPGCVENGFCQSMIFLLLLHTRWINDE